MEIEKTSKILKDHEIDKFIDDIDDIINRLTEANEHIKSAENYLTAGLWAYEILNESYMIAKTKT